MKITLLGAVVSVLCLFFLIDTKNNALEFYIIFIGVSSVFGGILGLFLGLFLWYSNVAPTNERKEDLNKNNNLTKKTKNISKIWDICLSLFAPVVFIVFYGSLFVSNSSEEKYEKVALLAYIGCIGFVVTSCILGIYQFILKIKRQKPKNQLIFRIILTLFAVCTIIALYLFYTV